MGLGGDRHWRLRVAIAFVALLGMLSAGCDLESASGTLEQAESTQSDNAAAAPTDGEPADAASTVGADGNEVDPGVKAATTSSAGAEDDGDAPMSSLAVLRSSGNQENGRWQVFTFDVPEKGPIHIVADWTGRGNVNVFLRNRARTTIAYSNSTSMKPERLSRTVGAGTYELAVLVKSGAADYVVHVNDGPEPVAGGSAPPPGSADPVPATPPQGGGAPAPGPARTGGEYAGQPPTGSVLWGATMTTDRLDYHERASGDRLALHRSFFQWSQRSSGVVKTARADHANGRLPWVSVKTPSWSEMAAGRHDEQIDELLRGIAALNGPVWLTIHHEPEGGGGVNRPDDRAGPAGHLAMNTRVRQRMTALRVDNVALAPILMSYTWSSYSGRDPEQWWAPGVYDFVGVDHYRESETAMTTGPWLDIRKWAQRKGVDIAVGEWGMRGTDAAAGNRVRDWYAHAIGSANDGQGARVVGLSAFDSGLNSPRGAWTLRGAQLTTFHELLSRPSTANVVGP